MPSRSPAEASAGSHTWRRKFVRRQGAPWLVVNSRSCSLGTARNWCSRSIEARADGNGMVRAPARDFG